MADVRDAGRLAALASYDILDTMPEQGFDDVVHLARQLCGAPVALVSLVAADRQWFKARSGFALRETDLDSSVCAHALGEPDLLVIVDLTRDPRTRANPLVLGDPFIRFYAGAPLRTDGGDVLGTLCVIDTEPRPAALTDAQADGLRRLARQVVNLLELRKAVSQRDVALSGQLREADALRAALARENRYRSVFDSITDFALIVTDRDGRVTEWNTGAERVLGWSNAEMRGHDVERLFTPEDRAEARARTEMRLSLEDGRASDERWHLRRDGGLFWASGEMMPLRDEDGIHRGYVKVLRDRTAEHLAGASLEATEARLRESEDHLRHTVELNPAVPWTCDPEGNITSYSKRWLDLTGQAPGEPDGTGWMKALHPDDVAHTVEVFSARLASGDPVDVDYRIRVAATGEHRWMRARAYPRHDGAGGIMRWYGVVEDVHDRKMAEARLRESEALFRTLAQAVPNHVWSATADGSLEWANEPTHAYSGLAQDGTVGDAWTARVHPEDLPAARERWRSSVATGATYETEFRVRRADGVYRWFLVRALPVRDPEGAVVHWIGANTDIEDQRALSVALALANATLEQRVAERTRDLDRLWRLSTDLMLVADFEGRIQAVNPAWTHFFGWSAEELVGSSFMDLVHQDDAAQTLAEVASLSQGITTMRFENRYRHKDGTYRWLSWAAVPDERLIHAIGRDVQAEKAAAEALRRTEEALRQSQKMEAVGQLTGGLAHDFNNLLTAITGGLDLLQMRMAQGRTQDLSRYIDMAQGAAKRAAALTHRLLAFSRRQTLAPKSTDVNRLVADLEDLIRRTVGPEISVETVMAAGLWNTLVDPSQLENAVLNLCINARDAMPDGGAIVIETGNATFDQPATADHDLPPGRYVTVSVSDDGTGMPPDVVARAFDPFFTTKPIGQGTGLGLSMIYGFSRQSGGQVRIDSEVGTGTRVRLYLPRHAGDEDRDPASAGSVDLPRARQGETVLVVDDETSVRMLVTDVLGDLGYGALEAADGAAGLEILRSDARIDLLVTDVGLPGGMNGRQVADAARDLRPGLKVLFITGYAENAVLSHGHLDPGMHVLTKPFAIDALAERIRGLIEG